MKTKFDSALSSIVISNRFELFVGLLTLSSVVLAKYWKLGTFIYLIIILVATTTFGAIAIITVEGEDNKTIHNFEDALWFSVTTLTISGFGDVRPITTAGRIIAVILSFIGLGIILGFISNVGSALVATRLGKGDKKLHDETKKLLMDKMNNLEQLHEDELEELFSLITNIWKGKSNRSSLQICSSCANGNPRNSIYCNKCGQKI